MKRLKELLEGFPNYRCESMEQNPIIKGITVDSRQVEAGFLFVCIKGYTVDGHHYVKQAQDNGAAAILAEDPLVDLNIPVVYVNDTNRTLSYIVNQFYDFPSNQLHLIGVTGTNGKTSVTYLLDEMFRAEQRTTAVIGTIQMKIADQVYPTANTTPEPSYLHQAFHQMVSVGVDHCMMEVSSHALDLGRVNGCDFDIAIFTNISQDHLDYHETMEDYIKAKTRLFYQLGNRYEKKANKYAVINKDDPYSEVFAHATSQPVITYGLTNDADVYATDIKLSANGTAFRLNSFKGQVDILTTLMGTFNVYNILAAATAALLAGVPLDKIQATLEQTRGVRGRFEAVKGDHDFGVIIDYAHTPDSLENVLSTIKGFAKQKVFLVVGCGGDRDRTKRPLMAGIGDKYADYTILTSDNPRSEDPIAIIADMEKGMQSTRYHIEVDRAKAIEQAIQMAQAEDIILIAGKGHETYQIIGNETVEFDDYKVAEQAISNK
ncbi:UDP-N-acetylmuramoyl-L-alanyl-D-glutamate--2,6-diaminopimelate ligase [Amphibacillus sediminis]|uniref:UDP-N-acetylmuramoyl-L-alanyl-D-glutamate--2, 6-diaminopimelate ligase n=1 Tax=Amphibacillus sediminis TaxID=360185 RepID=UPI00082D8C16|nr:UDP-N-acetylmuramoyl-L-alanyl-D-glutamate--2,6-diaminopimelate ligase [Amphibacillus sediminis]